jgi:hypothetical protein
MLRANSPIEVAARLQRAIAHLPLRAYLYRSTRDADTAQLAPLAAALRRAGASVVA